MRTDKVSGKLLKIRGQWGEIEGQGFYPFAEKAGEIYTLYGTLKGIIPPDGMQATFLRGSCNRRRRNPGLSGSQGRSDGEYPGAG